MNLEVLLLEWQQHLLAALLPKLGAALLIFLVSGYLSRLAGRLVLRALERRRVNSGAERLISETVRWSILVYGTISPCNSSRM